MILVTLGTQNQPFTRLLELIEKSDIKDEIIVQAGNTKFKSPKMKIFDYIPYEEMTELIKKADLIITHGGTGSILMPLKMGKKVIAVPRLAKYGEHVDDHQTQLTSIFEEEGYILEYKDGEDFNELYLKSKKFKPNKYVSNTENFINEIKNLIDQNEKMK